MTATKAASTKDRFLLTPFPKAFKENVDARRRLYDWAEGDRERQHAVWIRCARDIVFWHDSMLWTYSPKEHERYPDRPFITWDFQEEALLKLAAAIGKYDVLIEKSRDMGASWICNNVIVHRFQFYDRQAFLVGSRKEEYVEKSGDPKTLFWKVDYTLQNQVYWMRPQLKATHLHRINVDNGSTIDGESTNQDFATGDRRTAVFLDEFSLVEKGHKILTATRDVTRCRIFNGTPKGTKANAYYDRRKKLLEKHPERVVRLHWSQHPEKRRGLYTTAAGKNGGELVILDTSYDFPKDYPFILDGKLRSVWYDDQCDRAANQREISQELDIEYHESGWDFFEYQLLESYVKEVCTPPLIRGELDADPSNFEPIFLEQKRGRLLLWSLPDAANRFHFEDDDYVIGCDIATGKGGKQSSNSSANVWARRDRRKVARFSSNSIKPDEFAVYVACLARLFKGKNEKPALVGWEKNGPGGIFGAELVKIKFPCLAYFDGETLIQKKKINEPGWHSNKDSKRIMLSQYQKELVTRGVWNVDDAAVKECGEYEQDPMGNIYHTGSTDEDDLDYGENHGDHVIGDAIAVRLLNEFESAKPKAPSEPPPGSYAYRRKKFDDQERQKQIARNRWGLGRHFSHGNGRLKPRTRRY